MHTCPDTLENILSHTAWGDLVGLEVIIDPQAAAHVKGDDISSLIYRLQILKDDAANHAGGQMGVGFKEFTDAHRNTSTACVKLLTTRTAQGIRLVDSAVTRLEAAGIHVALPRGENRLVVKIGETGFIRNLLVNNNS